MLGHRLGRAPEDLNGDVTAEKRWGPLPVAVGVLMARHHLTREQAFDILRLAGQRTNRKVSDIAREVADTWSSRSTSARRRCRTPDLVD